MPEVELISNPTSDRMIESAVSSATRKMLISRAYKPDAAGSGPEHRERSMRRCPPSPLRHPAILPVTVLLAGLVLGGCQPPAAPKPDPHGQAAPDSGKAGSTEHMPTHLVPRLRSRR